MEEEGAAASASAAADSGKSKGRGHSSSLATESRYSGKGGDFESIDSGKGSGPARSVEGYIIFVTGVHEEAQEDDVADKFADFGDVKNIQVNLDRRSGFVKGYALIEYATFDEAQDAIEAMDGKNLLGKAVNVSWAFTKGASRKVEAST